jgi:hypothetical protein
MAKGRETLRDMWRQLVDKLADLVPAWPPQPGLAKQPVREPSEGRRPRESR